MHKLPGIVLDVQNLPQTIFTLLLKLNKILSTGRTDSPLELEEVTMVCGVNNTDLNSNLLLVLIVRVTVGTCTIALEIWLPPKGNGNICHKGYLRGCVY